jgi:hypothetical protein
LGKGGTLYSRIRPGKHAFEWAINALQESSFDALGINDLRKVESKIHDSPIAPLDTDFTQNHPMRMLLMKSMRTRLSLFYAQRRK